MRLRLQNLTPRGGLDLRLRNRSRVSKRCASDGQKRAGGTPPVSPEPALVANSPFALDPRRRSDNTCVARSSDTD
jgi:hypothetical protein